MKTVWLVLEYGWDGIEKVDSAWTTAEKAHSRQKHLIETVCKDGKDRWGAFQVIEIEVK